MDWAEELKMSIRKTARKGRRSKSRDVLKDGITSTVNSPVPQRDLSIDITLDLQGSSQMPTTSRATSTTTGTFDDTTRPPIRRISGGWADTSILKSTKSKKSFDDELFQFATPKSATNSIPDDDIPVIPDMDDIKDEVLLNEIAEPPSVSVNRVVTLKELNSDLLSQNAFSAIEDVDLSILTRCLQTQDTLDEADEVWDWDKVFTDVIAEINTDKSIAANNSVAQKIEIGPDEVPSDVQ